MKCSELVGHYEFGNVPQEWITAWMANGRRADPIKEAKRILRESRRGDFFVASAVVFGLLGLVLMGLACGSDRGLDSPLFVYGGVILVVVGLAVAVALNYGDNWDLRFVDKDPESDFGCHLDTVCDLTKLSLSTLKVMRPEIRQKAIEYGFILLTQTIQVLEFNGRSSDARCSVEKVRLKTSLRNRYDRLQAIGIVRKGGYAWLFQAAGYVFAFAHELCDCGRLFCKDHLICEYCQRPILNTAAAHQLRHEAQRRTQAGHSACKVCGMPSDEHHVCPPMF